MTKFLKDIKFPPLNVRWTRMTSTVKCLHSKQLASFLYTTANLQLQDAQNLKNFNMEHFTKSDKYNV